MDNFEFFGLNLGKLPNYVRYLGSNIVEGVAETFLEAEMSWLEVEMNSVEVDVAGWSYVEVDGTGWRWVHSLVIPNKNWRHIVSTISNNTKQGNALFSLWSLEKFG